MKFAEIINRSAIIKELKSSDKKGVIKELVEVIKSAYKTDNIKPTNIIDKLFKREKIGSTGIGNGIGVPHAKIDGLKSVLCAFGKSSKGIDFDAVDGLPVYIVFLLLTPQDNPELNLQALQLVARLTKEINFCKFLKEAKNTKEVCDTLLEFDEVAK